MDQKRRNKAQRKCDDDMDLNEVMDKDIFTRITFKSIKPGFNDKDRAIRDQLAKSDIKPLHVNLQRTQK